MAENRLSDLAAGGWEDRWVRFRIALAGAGVEPRAHEFCRGWVLGFLGFIKPRKFFQAERRDVVDFLQKLAGEGKKRWQVKQAEEALRLFFREAEPVKWAAGWEGPIFQELEHGVDEGSAAPVARPPTAGSAERFAGRSDAGELPQKYEKFVEAVEAALRADRYSYRTEQAYLDWTRRF